MHGIAALQPYVIGLVLLWASLTKLFSARMRAEAGRTALARLAGPARAVPALRLAGALELVVAAALLLPPVLPVEGVAATALSTGFLAYLAYARLTVPESSCGCLGAHSRPIEGRSFARAGLLLAASVAAIWAGPYTGGVWAALVAAAEVLVLLGLSPELDRHWLMPLRRLVVRVRKPLAPGPQGEVPLEVTLRLLYRSRAYCSASARLVSDVQDVWDEDGMRFVVYAAREGLAVFAVPLADADPAGVRVALVGEPALA
ncbi:hypothetical protein DQ384_05880 [Sphaerisporangium album]|uniref:Methylamine utilisation protein MauE domain-containing protein n=1 Tax=Sphaerisporangium album TaxID=509200 RepID=A0A367FNU8_9ACTN|nr:MauE/DoxX family redox-associated membrane protein [Sphaerisporangium album]RCG32058.1 hypothetical protein DQ384_05880 [Sphaerisporangium album]